MINKKYYIYDCEFHRYYEAIVSNNKVFVLGKSNDIVPAKNCVCRHVDN